MNWLDPEEVQAWMERAADPSPLFANLVWAAAAVEFVKALHKKNCLCCMGEGESSRIMVCVDLIARRLEDNDEREGTER